MTREVSKHSEAAKALWADPERAARLRAHLKSLNAARRAERLALEVAEQERATRLRVEVAAVRRRDPALTTAQAQKRAANRIKFFEDKAAKSVRRRASYQSKAPVTLAGSFAP